MNILIVHQNFPGQFPHIADALVKRGDRVAAIGSQTARGRPGVDLRKWQNKRGTTEGIFPQAVRAEADLIRATAAAGVALQLKRDGFTPDVIIGHPGWGETIHLKEVWPEAKMILLGEMFYRSRGGDTDFDIEFGEFTFAEATRVNSKGATQALAFALADRIICPTSFQSSSFPPGLQASIRVLHEGIDLAAARRRLDARVRLPQNAGVLDGSAPVITYVSRTLEPLRGFHIFMRALPELLVTCPEAHVVIVGTNSPSGYGARAPDGKTWLDWLLHGLGNRIDRRRLHIMGMVPHNVLIDLFSISWAHVYYTYPFVLSWSLLEAMACECLVVASDTPPLHDAITHGKDGLLLPFFDIAALAAALIRSVQSPQVFSEMRQSARLTARAKFDRSAGVVGWLDEIDRLAG